MPINKCEKCFVHLQQCCKRLKIEEACELYIYYFEMNVIKKYVQFGMATNKIDSKGMTNIEVKKEVCYVGIPERIANFNTVKRIYYECPKCFGKREEAHNERKNVFLDAINN